MSGDVCQDEDAALAQLSAVFVMPLVAAGGRVGVAAAFQAHGLALLHVCVEVDVHVHGGVC